tara:strand:- start:221 stop:517 length:297 start_codon:yes stop_codon:yes gene_type:complete
MKFGIMTSKIDEIGYITHAENLGYSHCWVTDSPMLRSNCWAVLALAANATRNMQIGTGVNVPGIRQAPVASAPHPSFCWIPVDAMLFRILSPRLLFFA